MKLPHIDSGALGTAVLVAITVLCFQPNWTRSIAEQIKPDRANMAFVPIRQVLYPVTLR